MIVGVYLLGRAFLGNDRRTGIRCGLWCSFAAACSPWSFHFSRVNFDPAILPCILVWAVYTLIRSGKLKAFRIGNRFRIMSEDLEKFKEEAKNEVMS